MRAKPASQYSDAERRELLARQKASGMSIRAFASTVGLSAATISHWRWRLSRSEPSAVKPTQFRLRKERRTHGAARWPTSEGEDNAMTDWGANG
jgi:transposase